MAGKTEIGSVVGVTAGVVYGPWRIPTRAQNMLINGYAAQRGITIDYLFEEGVYFEFYPRLRKLLLSREIAELVFCSAYQLPESDEARRLLQEAVGTRRLHFALENISCRGAGELPDLFADLAALREAGDLLSDGFAGFAYADFHDMLTRGAGASG